MENKETVGEESKKMIELFKSDVNNIEMIKNLWRSEDIEDMYYDLKEVGWDGSSKKIFSY